MPTWDNRSSGGAVATVATLPPPPLGAAVTNAPAAPRAGIAEGHVVVKASSLGTFYRSPKPGADPFTQIGDSVDADTELCLIEVMKLFTTLRAGVKGRLVQILVDDGVMVEHDQPLFVIDTNG